MDWQAVAEESARGLRAALLAESHHAYEIERVKLNVERTRAMAGIVAPGVAEAKNETLRSLALDFAYAHHDGLRELLDELATQNLARRNAAADAAFHREQLQNARAFAAPQWSGFSDEQGRPIAKMAGWPPDKHYSCHHNPAGEPQGAAGESGNG